MAVDSCPDFRDEEAQGAGASQLQLWFLLAAWAPLRAVLVSQLWPGCPTSTETSLQSNTQVCLLSPCHTPIPPSKSGCPGSPFSAMAQKISLVSKLKSLLMPYRLCSEF